MTQEPPVPRLDLAPKLKRPLSLWNLLDYLRLLYWVFYFPQALRWYVDTLGDGYTPPGNINWEFLLRNPVQRNLFLQGLLLTVVTPFVFCGILQSIGVSIVWQGMALGMLFGLPGTAGLGVAEGVALGVVEGVACGVLFGMTPRSVAISVAAGVAFGLLFGVVGGVILGVAAGVAFGVVGGVAVAVVGNMAFGVFFVGPVLGVIMGVAFVVAFVVAFGVAILRPESWLIGLSFNIQYLQRGSLLFLRVTSIPLPYVSVRLKKWLQQDWEAGLYNANQLLAYTLQFIPVVRAVNQVLTKTPPEQIIWHVSKLAEDPFDWKLVLSASATLREVLISENPKTCLGTFLHATAAGFWYLHEKEPAEAEEAFAVVRPLLYGEEMYTLAQNLAVFHRAEDVDGIASIPVETYHGTSLQSSQETLLRPKTWQAISKFHRVVQDIQLVQRSVSRATRAFALNRAQGELTNILNNSEILPQAERGLIIDIAETWQKALLQIAGEVGEISITQPVRNPYTVGDPVLGDRFVGREDVMRQLEELWVMGEQLQ